MTEKKHIHTTLEPDIHLKLKNLAAKHYGTASKLIEQAVQLLDVLHNDMDLKFDEINGLLEKMKIFKEGTATNRRGLDKKLIWLLMKTELGMVAVGKKTFLSYIAENPKKALKENIARDVIEWYCGHRFAEIPLKNMLLCIREIWGAANYFSDIAIQTPSENQYVVDFYHTFHDQRFSEYWADYFTVLLEDMGHTVTRYVLVQKFSLKIDCAEE